MLKLIKLNLLFKIYSRKSGELKEKKDKKNKTSHLYFQNTGHFDAV